MCNLCSYAQILEAQSHIATAQGESQVANIARRQVLCLSQDSYQELYTFIQSGSTLSVLHYN